MIKLLSLATTVLYWGAAIWQGLIIFGRIQPSKITWWVLSMSAFASHLFLLHHWIDVGNLQNLSVINVLSLVSATASGMVVLASFWRHLTSLSLFVFPWSGTTVVLAALSRQQYLVRTMEHPGEIMHILLSVFTVSVFFMAGAQALLLWIQECELHHKKPFRFIQQLPPVQTMEAMLFRLLTFAFVFLNLVLLTSFYFFGNFLIGHSLNGMILIFLAWAILAVLLLGRYWAGWRGRKAIWLTLLGVFLLLVVSLLRKGLS